MENFHLPKETIDEIVSGRVAADSEVRHIAECKECCDYYLLKRNEFRLYAPDSTLTQQLQTHEEL